MSDTIKRLASQDWILDPSLVLYLPLHQLDGSSFMSRDAYGHLCSVTGALWTPRGRKFDGVDDKITCGRGASLDNLLPLTYSVWVNFDAPYGELNPFLVSKDTAFAPANWLYVNAANQDIILDRAFADTNLNANSENGVVVAGAWANIVATIDANKVPRLYVNGTEVSYTTQTTGVGALTDDSSSDVYIGNSQDGTRTVDGLIGEVLIYNRALTLLEIQHSYLATEWRYR